MPVPQLLNFSPLASKHISEVVSIDADGVPPFWGPNEFRMSNSVGHNHSYVLEIGPEYRVVGFIAVEALAHHIQILNIGVTKEKRRQGYGRTLISGLRARFPNCSLHCMAYEYNLDFQLFLKGCGFICVAITKSDSDAYLFELPQDSMV